MCFFKKTFVKTIYFCYSKSNKLQHIWLFISPHKTNPLWNGKKWLHAGRDILEMEYAVSYNWREHIFFNDLNCGGTLLAIFIVMNKKYWNYPLRWETMSFSTVILFWFHSPDGPNVFNWHAAQLAAIPLCKTLCWNLIIKRMFIKLIIACLISNFHMEVLDSYKLRALKIVQ